MRQSRILVEPDRELNMSYLGFAFYSYQLSRQGAGRPLAFSFDPFSLWVCSDQEIEFPNYSQLEPEAFLGVIGRYGCFEFRGGEEASSYVSLSSRVRRLPLNGGGQLLLCGCEGGEADRNAEIIRRRIERGR